MARRSKWFLYKDEAKRMKKPEETMFRIDEKRGSMVASQYYIGTALPAYIEKGVEVGKYKVKKYAR